MDETKKAEMKETVKTILSEAKGEIKSEVSAELKAEVAEFVKAQRELIEKGVGAGHKDVVASRKVANAKLKSFAKALLNNDIATLKDMSTDTQGSPYAGYVVDSELSAEIRALQTTYGVARQEMTTLALSKNSYKANELVTDVSVFWTAEGSEISSTQVVLGQDTLTLAKMGAIAVLTRELLEDEEVDLFGFIAQRVAQKFSQKEDEAFFTGEGSGDTANNEYTGILNVVGVGAVELAGEGFANITADKLLDMQDQAPQAVAKNGKYYMHRSIRNLVRKLKNSITGEYIYQDATNNGPAMLWGRPVIEVEAMPSVADSAPATPFVAFGDLKTACLLGYKGAISADRFNAGVVKSTGSGDLNLITEDREAVRFIERVGYITIMPSAIVVMSTQAGS